jgi:hypothetical protein
VRHLVLVQVVTHHLHLPRLSTNHLVTLRTIARRKLGPISHHLGHLLFQLSDHSPRAGKVDPAGAVVARAASGGSTLLDVQHASSPLIAALTLLVSVTTPTTRAKYAINWDTSLPFALDGSKTRTNLQAPVLRAVDTLPRCSTIG